MLKIVGDNLCNWFKLPKICYFQIYTPKVSKKRPTARRVDDEEHSEETDDDDQFEEMSNSESNKSSGSKLWSFVSTIMRFASLTPACDLSMPEIKGSDNESHVIIKRCASFTGNSHHYSFIINGLNSNTSQNAGFCNLNVISLTNSRLNRFQVFCVSVMRRLIQMKRMKRIRSSQ